MDTGANMEIWLADKTVWLHVQEQKTFFFMHALELL